MDESPPISGSPSGRASASRRTAPKPPRTGVALVGVLTLAVGGLLGWTVGDGLARHAARDAVQVVVVTAPGSDGLEVRCTSARFRAEPPPLLVPVGLAGCRAHAVSADGSATGEGSVLDTSSAGRYDCRTVAGELACVAP